MSVFLSWSFQLSWNYKYIYLGIQKDAHSVKKNAHDEKVKYLVKRKYAHSV